MNKMMIKYKKDSKVKSLNVFLKNEELFLNKNLLLSFKVISIVFFGDSCDIRVKSKDNKYNVFRINNIEDIIIDKDLKRVASHYFVGFDNSKINLPVQKERKISQNYFNELIFNGDISRERKDILKIIYNEEFKIKPFLSYCNYIDNCGYNEKLKKEEIQNRFCIIMLLFKNNYNLFCYKDINILYFLNVVRDYDNASILIFAKYFMNDNNLEKLQEKDTTVTKKLDIIAKEIKKCRLKVEDVEKLEPEIINKRLAKILLRKTKN